VYVIIAGGGKVGWNIARELIEKRHEVTLIEQNRRRYLIIEARVNNPRNLQHFKLLGIGPAVSATDLILRLIEHEVPRYGLVHLLDLGDEGIEIIEVEISEGAPAAGQEIGNIELPEGSLIIAVLRKGTGFVPKPETVIEPGDEVLVVLDPGLETAITTQFRTETEE
jgi:trk system potassium uptake protein TrkA